MAMQTFDDDELGDIKPQSTQTKSATATASAVTKQQPVPQPKSTPPAPVRAAQVPSGEDFEDESKPAPTTNASAEDNLDTDFDDERIYHRSGQLTQCRPDKNLKAVRFAFVSQDWIKPKSAKTHFLKGLGKDEKMGRFRCLSPLGSDDQGLCCVALDKDGETTIVALVIRYLNANAEGKYIKGADGSVPPIEWELQFVRLSQFNMKQIKKLAPEDSDVFHIDIIMSLAEGRAFGYEFTAPTAGVARWLKNPQLFEEIKHSVQRFADGKTLISKLGKKLSAMEWKALLSGVNTGVDNAKLENMEEL